MWCHPYSVPYHYETLQCLNATMLSVATVLAIAMFLSIAPSRSIHNLKSKMLSLIDPWIGNSLPCWLKDVDHEIIGHNNKLWTHNENPKTIPSRDFSVGLLSSLQSVRNNQQPTQALAPTSSLPHKLPTKYSLSLGHSIQFWEKNPIKRNPFTPLREDKTSLLRVLKMQKPQAERPKVGTHLIDIHK